jgi:hypothetical protein
LASRNPDKTMKSLMRDIGKLRLHLAVALLAALVFKSHAQTIPTNGLVAYYPFNGNATDESGNGNTGTATGVTYQTDRFGDTNKSAFFSGSLTSYIQVSNRPSLFNSAALSVSVWVYVENGGMDYSRIFSKGWSPNAVEAIINVDRSQPKTVGFGGAYNGVGYGVTSVKSLTYAVWTMLVFTDDGYKRSVYINGQLDNTSTHNLGLIPPNTIDLFFGKNSQNPSGAYTAKSVGCHTL